MASRFKLLSFLKCLAIAYLLVCLFMWAVQRYLLYLPQTDIRPPEIYGLHDFSDLRLKSKDGTSVQAWFHKARPGYPTIVFFHGNGGHLGFRAEYFQLLTDAGFGVLALSYRGYGASAGSPSEEGFYQDARATMDYATRDLSLAPHQIIIYGESIGTGVAVQMAVEYAAAALILQSPYTSIEALAQENYPWLPVHFLLKDRFDSLSKISKVHAPLLLFHGEKDSIVPIHLGKTLFDKASEPKEAIYFPHFGHNDIDLELLTQSLVDFSEKHRLISPK